MVSTIAAKDAGGATLQLAVVDGGVAGLIPVHVEQSDQRAALIAALTPLATAAGQASNASAIVAALQAQTAATQPVSLSAVPLPNGAATEATLALVKTALGGVLAVTGPLTAAQLTTASLATSAKQDALLTALGSPLQAGGAVTVSGVATAAGQSTGNTSLATIATALSNPLAVTGPLTSTQLASAGLAGAAQLPATLGVRAAAASLSVALATDGVYVTMTQAGNASLASVANSLAGTLKADTVIQAVSVDRGATVGTTAQNLMAANPSRRGFSIQNQSTSATVYISGVSTATADYHCLAITAGQYYESPPHHVGTGAVSIISSAASTPVYAREW